MGTHQQIISDMRGNNGRTRWRTMKTFRHIQWMATALAVLIMIGPHPLYGALTQESARPQAVISDIRLASGGLLEGRLVDSQAQPVENATVAILHDRLEIARATTDANGAFHVGGLRGGVHQITGPTGTATCRLWQPGMAPPSARDSAIIITAGPLVRGQQLARQSGCQSGCPTGCNNNCQTGCRTVCQTFCPPNITQVSNCPPNQGTTVQPLATTLPATDRQGQLVQYQEAVPGTVMPGTVQGPPPGPYGQPPVVNSGYQGWGWNPEIRDIFIACGIAAAIAIPIAIANSGKRASP